MSIQINCDFCHRNVNWNSQPGNKTSAHKVRLIVNTESTDMVDETEFDTCPDCVKKVKQVFRELLDVRKTSSGSTF